MDSSDPIVSMVIFEWKDYELVGVVPDDSSQVCSFLGLLGCQGQVLIIF